MAPFPHSAPRATISPANPVGTDGFELVEFAHPEPRKLRVVFQRMGYALTARHKTRAIELWQQGDITCVLNDDAGSHARRLPRTASWSTARAWWMGARRLLQVFSKTVMGPIFLEFIQRKGDDGFGEGNFKALFESIKADQIARGVLLADQGDRP